MKKNLGSILLIVLILTSSVFVGTAFAASAEKIPVIVGFKGLPDPALINAFGGQITYEYSIIPAIACSLPSQAIDALKKNPNVAYVEEDFAFEALEYGYPTEDWGITQIGANTVHTTNRGVGVKVAVIDTGINKDHLDLNDNYKGGYDFVNQDSDPMDDNGHGTHCAGIIAADLDGPDDLTRAVVGVAPEAWLYAYKVLNRRGTGTTSTILAGINQAVIDGVQVISLSLGSTSYSQGLHDACLAAVEKNVVVVAASGNSGNTATGSTVNYPAKFDFVIAVGATDVNDNLATFSSTGPEVDVVAPGVRVLSDYKDINPNDGLPNSDTAYMDGTSMACPHVAGTVALILKANPSLTPVQVQKILQDTAVDLGSSGPDSYYGYGRIDAAKAVGQCAPSLTVSIVNPTSGSTVEGSVPVQAIVTSEQSSVSVTYTVGATSSEMAYNSESGSYEALWITTGLDDGPYTIEVTATDLSGSATATINVNVDNYDPAKVEGLSATATSSTQISLAWTSNSELDLKGYNIHRSEISESTGFSFVTFVAAPSYIDAGLAASTTYYYYVEAVDQESNTGVPSIVVSAKTYDPPVSQPLWASITMSLKTKGINTYAIATVTIRDTSGNTIPGAIVTGQWSEATDDVDTVTTNTNGVVVLESNNVRNAKTGTTTFTFTITGVTKEGYALDPNSETSDSITK